MAFHITNMYKLIRTGITMHTRMSNEWMNDTFQYLLHHDGIVQDYKNTLIVIIRDICDYPNLIEKYNLEFTFNCAEVTPLHVMSSLRCLLFLSTQSQYVNSGHFSFGSPWCWYTPCCLPGMGEHDTYGNKEKCDRKIIVEKTSGSRCIFFLWRGINFLCLNDISRHLVLSLCLSGICRRSVWVQKWEPWYNTHILKHYL